MYYIEFERLSLAGKKCYVDMYNQLCNMNTKITVEGYDKNTVPKAYIAVFLDHPELFWLNGGYDGEFTERGSHKVAELNVNTWFRDLSILGALKKTLNDTVDKIVAGALRFSTVYERVLYVHDYIVNNTVYDMKAPHRYSAMGVLIDKRAVCAGYSAAFQLVMHRLGIPCCRITGNKASSTATTTSHEWNCIEIGGKFYFVDVTWDDPTVERPSSLDNLTHEYLCLCEKELSRTHRISRERYVPDCTDAGLEYYRARGFYIYSYSFDTFKRIALDQMVEGNRIQVRFSSKNELNEAVYDLIKNRRIFDIFKNTKGVTYNVSESGVVLSVLIK